MSVSSWGAENATHASFSRVPDSVPRAYPVFRAGFALRGCNRRAWAVAVSSGQVRAIDAAK